MSPKTKRRSLIQFPNEFQTRNVETNGAVIHVRHGGHGPAVVMLHGFGTTGDQWSPLASALVQDHTVIVPDLRGLGLSSKPDGGYDKKTQAGDVAGIMDAIGVRQADLVTHDLGNMVGYAFASQNPERVRKFVPIDAPLPGVGPWDDVLKEPSMWHFGFRGPDMERLVEGRERIYLDRFWNEFSIDPTRFDEEARQHYAALYARPGAMRAGFAQFAAFEEDVVHSKEYLSKGKLAMPILAIGAQATFGAMMAAVMRSAATDVREEILPDSGHWIMEENPSAIIDLVQAFLN
jgi:pimeloyl-ACP methyl ester carboxylesterase